MTTMDLRVDHLDTRARSRGCLSCIRMKVKCDEKRPNCQRCMNARRQCPGYRAPATTFVIKSGDSKARVFSATALPEPKPQLRTDWTQNAVSHYVHHFVVGQTEGMPGMHDSLPELCTQYPRTLYLQSAIQAVAMATLARVNKMSPRYLSRARNLYGNAIRSLRIALDDEAERSSATALMTTELLSEYDLIVGQGTSATVSPHQQGMLLILQKRLLHDTTESPSVTQGAFIYFLLQNVGQACPPAAMPPPLEMYPGQPPAASDNVSCTLLGLMHQAVSLRAAPSAAGQGQDDVECHMAELSRVNADLLRWELTMPAEWRYGTHSTSAQSTWDSGLPQSTLVFSGLNSMMLWNTYWMTRLGVLLCMDQLQLSMAENPNIHFDMMLLVDRICSATPYMTGQMEGTGDDAASAGAKILASVFAMRSLLVACKVPRLPEGTSLWISRQLEFIAKYKGVGQDEKVKSASERRG